MGERGRVNASEGRVPGDPEVTLAAPRFDDKSVQRAQPAVPLAARGRVPARSVSIVLVCAVAALAGAFVGVLALTLYQRDSRPAAGLASARPHGEPQTPGADASAPDEPSAAEGEAATEPETLKAAGGRDDVPGAEAGAADDAPAATRAGEEEALRGALGEWLAATNARDIGRQMSFYDESVGSFYLTRNVTRAAVRAEKSRVFAAASTVDVRAGEPTIRLGPDGRTAVMRFRKRYRIEGGGQDRRGEVLQELRWRRTPQGWKIVGERDLRVLQ
jgi:ketosteroid isomerase-like protein